MYLYYLLLLLFVVIGFILKGDMKIGKNGLTKKAKKIYIMITFGIMLLLSALKSVNVGVDTKHYYEIFEWIKGSDVLGRYEPGFFYLTKFLGNKTDNFQTLVIVSSIIMFIPFAVYIYYESKDVVFSTLIFYLVYFISFNTMMRQGMAMGASMIALMCYKRKRYLFSLLLVAIAVSFHYSALILILIPIISHMKYKLRNLIYCMIFAIIMVRFNIVDNVLKALNINSAYLESAGAGGSDAVIHTLISTITIFCFYWSGSNHKLNSGNKNIEEDNNVERNLMLNYKTEIWAIFLYMIFYILTIAFPVSSRFSSYFAFGFLTALPNKLSNVHNGKFKFIVYSLIIGIYVAYQTIVFIFRPAWGGVFPYTFFWQI